MLDVILRLVRAVLHSLYLVFEGIPAMDALRRWLGAGEAAGAYGSRLFVFAGALIMGVIAFLAFLWLLLKRPSFFRRDPVSLHGGHSGTHDSPSGREAKHGES